MTRDLHKEAERERVIDVCTDLAIRAIQFNQFVTRGPRPSHAPLQRPNVLCWHIRQPLYYQLGWGPYY